MADLWNWFDTLPGDVQEEWNAMRAIVQAVADMPLAYSHEAGNYCAFCEASDDDLNIGRGVLAHTPECPVTKARALLADKAKE